LKVIQRGKDLLQTVLDFIYPRRCPICGDIAIPRGELACEECRSVLKAISEPRCKKCSKPIENEEKEYCLDCETKKHHYTKGFALWIYDSVMKKSLADFKFHGRQEYAAFYAEEFIKYYEQSFKQLALDVLVPIPIHKQKQLERGYNQAEILAKELGKKLNITVLSRLLQRDKNTLPQNKLNNKERLRNLEKAFSISQKELEAYSMPIKKVMLVDDIYTTGSTMEACTNILLKSGVEEVYFFSVCIGKGF